MKPEITKFKRKARGVLKILILVSLLSATLYMFLFISTKRKIREAAVLDRLVEKEEISKYESGRLIQETTTLADKSDILDSFFIDPNTVVIFLESLEELGRKTGVSVSIISVKEGEAEKKSDLLSGTIAPLSVKLTADGSFKNVYNFLTLLENAPYEIVFDRIQLLKDEETGWSGEFNIVLQSYIVR